MRAILAVRQDALFIQSESSEYFHAESPAAIKRAQILNEERFLSLDLNYGQRVNSEMYEFLTDHGMSREEYRFFLENDVRHHCVMGNDYYVTNEHRVTADGGTFPAGEVFGYCEITRQYYERYRLPVMHTETNTWQGPKGDEASYWLWKEWANVPEPAQQRHPGRRVHVVFADRPDRLGSGVARGKRHAQSARPLRPRPENSSGGRGVPTTGRGLERGVADAEPLPDAAARPNGVSGWVSTGSGGGVRKLQGLALADTLYSNRVASPRGSPGRCWVSGAFLATPLESVDLAK